MNLENEVLLRVTPSILTNGTVGTAYSQQLEVVGGQPPYTFALAPGSPGLPSGLTVSSSGLVFGTPDTPGTFDFTVRMTDGGGRSIDQFVTITIGP